MIIDCPRCGFSQPKDRYCANCGLDIDHFKPVAEPKLKALAQNTMMQVILVVIVVVALASGIYTAQQKTVKEQLAAATQEDINAAAAPTPATPEVPVSNPTAPPVQSPAPASPARAARSTRAATTASLTNTSSDAEAEVANENAELGAGETSEPNPGVAAGGPSAPAAPPKTLNVVFIEMPRMAIDQIAAENQILNEYDGTRSIMIAGQPSPASLGGVPLPGSAVRQLAGSKRVEFAFNAGQETFGLRLDIGHTYHNDQEFDLEVVGQVSLPALDGSTANTGMNGKYTIPKNATLVIAGMVRPQPIRQEYQAFFARSPLVIMGSPQFQSTQSQFVVLIQPK